MGLEGGGKGARSPPRILLQLIHHLGLQVQVPNLKNQLDGPVLVLGVGLGPPEEEAAGRRRREGELDDAALVCFHVFVGDGMQVCKRARKALVSTPNSSTRPQPNRNEPRTHTHTEVRSSRSRIDLKRRISWTERVKAKASSGRMFPCACNVARRADVCVCVCAC